MRQLLPGVAMISGTGRNVENSSSGVALTGFLEIPSIAELLSGTEWNLKEIMRYVFPGNGTKKTSEADHFPERPVKARNVSACKHWLSGLLKCSVCGATLSYTGNNKCPYFQCWKYAKGFHKTSVALSVKKGRRSCDKLFDQILDGAEFTYVCKKKKTDHSLQIDQLQREISKLAMREGRIKEAYEAGVDTLAEYKNNKDRLVSDRLELTAALSQLLQEEQSEQPNTEEVLKEIRSVADVLKNPDVGYERKKEI